MFPAYAGMDRKLLMSSAQVDMCSPPTRGDGPELGTIQEGGDVFPAYAGMDRIRTSSFLIG